MQIRIPLLFILVSGCFINQSIAADAPVDLEKIEVTGSHIKRIDSEGPSPVLVVSREDIERSGLSSVSELLRNLALNSGEAFNENYIASFAPGSSGINLRGLGQDKTLVLINGRRVAKYAFASELTVSFVDLNSIPLGAIERIEIQKDGASAIYGSDAIAGVVNIILRKNYNGSEISLAKGISSRDDANEKRFNFIDGADTDKGNITFVLDYFSREDVGRIDRKFSSSADHTGKPQGQDFTSPTFPVANVLDTINPFPLSILAFNGFYDPNPDFSLIPESERLGTMVNFNRDISNSVSLFGQFMYNQVETNSFLSPSDVFGDFDGVVVPAGQLFNTHGQDVFPYWRVTELGRRTLEVETDNHQIVTGLEGEVSDFEWDAAVHYNKSKTDVNGDNYINRLALIDAINNDLINPFGTSANDPDVIDSIRAQISRTGISEIFGFDAKATTQAGPVALAIGVGRYTEKLTDRADSLSSSGQILGAGTTSANGKRDVESLFFEINYAVTDDVEMQLAARNEDYSDFGSSSNPKLAVRYQPVDSVLLRASWGTGFRAPSLSELHIGESLDLPFLVDTNRCAASGAATDCTPSQYGVLYSGNEDLEAEESESLFLGAVFEPVSDLSIGLDYWQFDTSNVIDNNAQFILDNEASFPGQVIRDAPAFAGDPGQVLVIFADFVNIADQETNGIDLELKYKVKAGNLGTFSFRENLTKIMSFKQKISNNSGFEDLEGTYRFPELRSASTFGWAGKSYESFLTANYISSYDGLFNGRINSFTGTTDTHKIGSFVTWDFQFVYSGFDATKISFGIENIRDTAPAFDNSQQEGFDIATHNPLGRFYYAKYSYAF